MPPNPINHTTFMSLAIAQARLDTSPPAPGKFRVGAVLVNACTGEILSSGHSLELPGDMPSDKGATHAEQCCFMKLALQHNLPVSRAEEYIGNVLPEEGAVLYTTMAPCWRRSVAGARSCCERIGVLRGKVRRVVVGMGHLLEGEDDDKGRTMLERAGVEVVETEEMREECYEAAIASGGVVVKKKLEWRRV